jgi:acyl-coenzyme A synthetase/AMP-(fatty) acid ligase
MNIADSLAERADANPYGVALIAKNRILHFGALDKAVWRAAAWLRANGVKPGDVVALAMAGGALNLVAGYALARMGAVQLHLARTDSEALSEQLAARHGVVAVLASRKIRGLAGIRRLRADPRWLEDDGQPTDASLRAPGGAAPWLIVRTSGTTAAPKSVLQSHATFVARRKLAAGPYGFAPGDRYLAVIPLDFVLGYKMCMDAHWVGAAVIFATDESNFGSVLEIADRHGATFTYLTPSQLGPLAQLAPDRPRLPGLRVLRCGSMAMPEALRHRVIERISPNLVISYGTSDLDCGITEADARTQARFPGSVGKARAGVELEIVDDDASPVPAGETGRVRVRVPDMPTGYFEDPQATALAFRDGWFYPGDLGTLDPEGVLYLKGRSDDMMNCDGVKIYPADIEAALLAHPAVLEAAAFPLESDSRQHIPVAAVVLRETVPAGALKDWCRERLGVRAPHMIERLDKLPRGESGKVLTREIARNLKHREN